MAALMSAKSAAALFVSIRSYVFAPSFALVPLSAVEDAPPVAVDLAVGDLAHLVASRFLASMSPEFE